VPLSVRDSEKLAGNDRENIGGRQSQTLQQFGIVLPLSQRTTASSLTPTNAANPAIVRLATKRFRNAWRIANFLGTLHSAKPHNRIRLFDISAPFSLLLDVITSARPLRPQNCGAMHVYLRTRSV
jgi:hypothetical protein